MRDTVDFAPEAVALDGRGQVACGEAGCVSDPKGFEIDGHDELSLHQRRRERLEQIEDIWATAAGQGCRQLRGEAVELEGEIRDPDAGMELFIACDELPLQRLRRRVDMRPVGNRDLARRGGGCGGRCVERTQDHDQDSYTGW